MPAVARWPECLEDHLTAMGSHKVDLYFFRHGLADWPHWKGSDDDRPLTEKGRDETVRVAKYLARHEVKTRKILTSPLPRASQTAAICAEYLDAPFETTKHLDKRFGVSALRRILDRDIESVVLVGHEPNFSAVIKKITGGAIKLRKSGVARVTVDLRTMRGRLEWLLEPSLCQL
jgi:phosphohistidine phosphatase